MDMSANSPTAKPAAKAIGANIAEQILVLDFGSQTAQLIARRVRENNVFCQMVRHDLPASRIREIAPKGLILSGGPASVYGKGSPQPDPEIFNLGIPILGICYGMQVTCHSQGGQVAAGHTREFGHAPCRVLESSGLFDGVPAEFQAWMSHGDQVRDLPAEFSPIANTETCLNAAVKHRTLPVYGLQFHPEVTHTEYGSRLLANFVKGICGCRGTWKISDFIEQEVASIRQRVGSNRVICGLSGGVDSSVVAALLSRAIGDQVSCIFVDNGMLRQGESEQVREQFAEHFKTDLHVVDAKSRFLDEHKGVKDPQQKRKIIGETFVRVFEAEAERTGPFQFLAQGTLYPDVIESTTKDTKAASKIKTHHNVGGLPDDMTFTGLVEPLRFLFKDEVRAVGRALGLPDEIVERQPFPGPGLAVRILGPITREDLELVRRADSIVRHCCAFAATGINVAANTSETMLVRIRPPRCWWPVGEPRRSR